MSEKTSTEYILIALMVVTLLVSALSYSSISTIAKNTRDLADSIEGIADISESLDDLSEGIDDLSTGIDAILTKLGEVIEPVEPVEPVEPDIVEYQKTLTLCVGREYDGLDFQVLYWVWHAHDFIGQPLVMYDKDLNIVPALAERFEIVDDGYSVIFYMAEDAKFSNGDPINAEALKQSMDRIKAISPFADSWLAPIQSTEIIDEYAIKIVLNSHVINKWEFLGECTGSPVNARVANEVGNDAFNQNPVSTGAWKVKEWVHGSHLVLERNEFYKTNLPYVENKGPNPYIDEVIIRFIPEALTRISEFDAGNVDILFGIPGEHIPKLRADPDVVLYEAPMPQIVYLTLNNKFPALDDVRIRKAIAYAVNRDDILVAIDGAGDPLYTFTSPSQFFFNPWLGEYFATLYPYNEGKAKNLLAEAGWTDTDGDGIADKDGNSLTFEMLVAAARDYAKFAPVLKDQLQKVGIHVDLQVIDSSYIRERMQAGNFEMAISTYGGIHPQGAAAYFHSVTTNMDIGYNNTEVNRILDLAIQVPTTVERIKLYTDLNLALLDDMPVIPLFDQKAFAATHKNLTGLQVLPPWMQFILNDVRIEK